MSSGHEFSGVLFFFRRAHMIACDEDTTETQIDPPSQCYDPLRHFCIARRTVPFQTSQPHCAISAQICCGPQALLAAALRTRQNRPPAVKDRRPPHHLHIKNKPPTAPCKQKQADRPPLRHLHAKTIRQLIASAYETAIPTSITKSAAIHATTHCPMTTPSAHLPPSSRFTQAIAATHGV